MKSLRIIIAGLLLLLALTTPLLVCAADKPLTEREKIQALINHVENLKDAKFIRNGSTHDAKTAAKFLRGKWQAHEKEIKTVVDFIEKVASFSSTSGKPYVIHLNSTGDVQSGEYLKQELKKLEQTESAPAS
jgi:hypothetical protein